MANKKIEMSIFRPLAVTVVASLILVVGCGPDERHVSRDDDISAIRSVIDRLTDDYVARDWDSFANAFTNDGIWMPPGVAPLRGKEAWRAWVQPWWDSSTVLDIGVSTEEITVIDDWAIERHIEHQTTVFGMGEEPASLHFKGIWIFRRQEDGTWKIAQYIWNENAPPE